MVLKGQSQRMFIQKIGKYDQIGFIGPGLHIFNDDAFYVLTDIGSPAAFRTTLIKNIENKQIIH